MKRKRGNLSCFIWIMLLIVALPPWIIAQGTTGSSKFKQGALGGDYDYLVNGKMIGGFALLAYPAEYGLSGVMTFTVNQDGVIYEKDLGKETKKLASAMKKFDPDKTWKKAE